MAGRLFRAKPFSGIALAYGIRGNKFHLKNQDTIVFIHEIHLKIAFANSCYLGSITIMMTSSNGIIFRVTGHLCGEFHGEFPAQRPATRSFDVWFDMRLNKRLSKQSLGWIFETPSRPLWRHSYDVIIMFYADLISLRPIPGSAFIKPDQRNPWIKDQLGNALLSTILHLQLPSFVSCGRDKPSHTTHKFGNSRCKIVGRRVIFIWSLIHGSSWSGLIKVGPGAIRFQGCLFLTSGLWRGWLLKNK